MPAPFYRPGLVDQTTFGDDGNCLAASLASVLGMSIAEMPDLRGDGWYDRLVEFLASRGRRAAVVPHHRVPDGSHVLNIGLGDGPRGRPHAVVCSGATVFHDPHPDRTGLVGAPEHHVFVLR